MEISVLTNDSQLLGEIMPMIYKRFTEKAAEEWRQIYKVFRNSSFMLPLKGTETLTLPRLYNFLNF